MTSREQYKILALTEKIGKLVSEYENQVADLRVELTVQSEALNMAQTEIQQLRDQLANSNVGQEVVVDGEVVNVQEETH